MPEIWNLCYLWRAFDLLSLDCDKNSLSYLFPLPFVFYKSCIFFFCQSIKHMEDLINFYYIFSMLLDRYHFSGWSNSICLFSWGLIWFLDILQVCLDNTITTEKELDTVEVLKAIQKAKDVKYKMSNSDKKVRHMNRCTTALTVISKM